MINMFKVFMAPDAGKRATDVLYSGMITQGPRVEEYEAELRNWFGFDKLLSVNSGTSALQLALDLAGVKAGDTVISTPMTCSATNTAILSRQANIVWADIDPATGNVSVGTIIKALKQADAMVTRGVRSPVKAIMMVHWGGMPCDVLGINGLAQLYGIKTIEDAAHAIGTEVGGVKLGQFSDFTCFSTQAIKHLTTVDGGILVCRDQEDYQQGRLLRWFGLDRDGPRKDFRCELDLARAGYKYHMNDVTAAIGLANLPYLDGILRAHRENADFYDGWFSDVEGITPVSTYHPTPPARSARWIYTMLLPQGKREAFQNHMTSYGVQTSQVHAPNHRHSFAKAFYTDPLPGVELFSACQINIPVGWWVTPEDRVHIAKAVSDFAEREL